MRCIASIGLVSLLLVGCGGEEQVAGPSKPPDTWVNQKPIVMVASPGAMSVGETMTIIGQRFLDKVHGKVVIQFKGSFFNSQGGSHPVDYQANAIMVNSGKLHWEMWPNVVFHPQGDQLGRFVGNLVVMNHGNDGSQLLSDPLPMSINIKPSLIPRAVYPQDKSCSGIVTSTLEKLPMTFMVQALGLRAPTEDNPLTFHWTFFTEQWKVAFNHGVYDLSAVLPKSGPITLEDKVTSGMTSTIADSGNRNVLVKLGSDSMGSLLGESKLKELQTGEVPQEGDNLKTTVNVAVVDSAGKQAQLTIPLTVHRAAEMSYNGAMVLVERYAPVMVSDCIPGGDIGRDVNYHESSSESRSRSMGFNWNVSGGTQIGPLGFINQALAFVLQLNFNAGFGVNTSEQVSSDKSTSLSINGHILPGNFGSFYRQTSKYYRIGTLTGYGPCGQTVDLGDAVLTDWTFTPDLASGTTCPAPTKLQPAQKFRK